MDRYEEELITRLRQGEVARFRDLQTFIRNPRTLSRKLTALKQSGLVEQENGRYQLTERGVRAARALEDLKRAIKDPTEPPVSRVPHPFYGPVLKKYVQILHDHFGDRLRGILLFGSIARGDWTPDSDIDLIVIVDDWENPAWKRIRELWPLKVKLIETDEYRRAESNGFTPIPHHYPLSRPEALEPHRVYRDASLEGRILYEKDAFLTELLDRVRNTLAQEGAYRVSLPSGDRYWILGAGQHVST